MTNTVLLRRTAMCYKAGVTAGIFGVVVGALTAYLFAHSSCEHGAQLVPENTHHHHRGKNPPRSQECDVEYLQTATPRMSRYLLLVLLDTKIEDRQLREASRSTWLSAWKTDYSHKFVVAIGNASHDQLQQLACENKLYGDLLVLPAISEDHASSATDKFLAASAWAESTNIIFSYVFKCDVGAFVNLEVIVSELIAGHVHPPSEGLLWGFFAGNVTAEDPDKWRLCDTYLPYPEGGGYVISWDLVQLLLLIADDLERFSRDDVAMGAWLAPFTNIHRKHDVRFNTGRVSRGCNNAYIVTSGETSSSMAEKEQGLETFGRICAEEYRTRPSYEYNWSAPVDKCCIMSDDIP